MAVRFWTLKATIAIVGYVVTVCVATIVLIVEADPLVGGAAYVILTMPTSALVGLVGGSTFQPAAQSIFLVALATANAMLIRWIVCVIQIMRIRRSARQ